MKNAKVTCAGCGVLHLKETTTLYRKKVCCGLRECLLVIDEKIKHANYKKQRRKYLNGTHRRGLDKKLKESVLSRDGHICTVCGENSLRKLDIHHIVFVSEGGTDEMNNLVTLCKECHYGVHIMPKDRYVDYFKAYTGRLSVNA
jgi:5-methylcytosine-specific restriction endonuclease McrA